MTQAERTELNELRAENAKLKAPKPLKIKIGQKGGLSVYGLHRFPVTLYKNQWTHLLSFSDTIKEFIVRNDAHLIEKDS